MTTQTTHITSKWQTIAIVGYSGSVSRHENRWAHGGVCMLQARRGVRGLLGRKVNSTGMTTRQNEVGESFPLDAATLAQWQMIQAGR